jgi:hypothetical protein
VCASERAFCEQGGEGVMRMGSWFYILRGGRREEERQRQRAPIDADPSGPFDRVGAMRGEVGRVVAKP